IATPKFNLYQSLHTTVVGPQGKPLEVQIRDRYMHERAERGVASHWGYKEGGAGATENAPWLHRLIDWQQDTLDPDEFLETLKSDLDQDEVYVFTPKGLLITLPIGATPVDFAYAIHTEVGHRCIGAKINGRLVKLDTRLDQGDSVEIFTAKGQHVGPKRDWLEVVVTPRARNKIRAWFSKERREDAIETGREELSKAIRREGLPVQKLASSPMMLKLAEEMSYADLDALHAGIGDGHVSAKSIAQRLARELHGGDHEEQLPATARQPRSTKRPSAGVYVEGLDDVMVRLALCCTPVPGDEITGFVTRGRGVSVHRADCANATALTTGHENRMIEVEWIKDRPGTFVVSVEIKALDRSRLLLDVTRVLSEHHVNILRSETGAGVDQMSRMRFDFELADAAHLDSLLAALKRVDSVYDAYRLLPGKGPSASRS
ncbi:MAG TPA: TGS domain-containing protein, partial [Acidimicrobiales bacterium]|nr:TGS domain-containing protein [Acidimicrobiales bacterium]